LILSRNPNLSALEVKQILLQTADKDLKIESETPVNEPGDFISGFSLWFGNGKVNAANAVRAAAPTTGLTTIDRSIQPNLAIPDSGVAVFSKLEISENGTIDDLRIGIDLTHTYIGDLRIDITAPDGSSVTLHDRQGNSIDNINKVYTVANLPALRGFMGKQIKGTWIVSVVDTWRMDIGQLDAWRLIAKVTTN
jgi:subtilisin-like proprotein convertase family protein